MDTPLPPPVPRRAKLTMVLPANTTDEESQETLEFVYRALDALLVSALGVPREHLTVNCQRHPRPLHSNRLELTLIVIGLVSEVKARALYDLIEEVSLQYAVDQLERVTLYPTTLVIDFVSPDHPQVQFSSRPFSLEL